MSLHRNTDTLACVDHLNEGGRWTLLALDHQTLFGGVVSKCIQNLVLVGYAAWLFCC